MVGSIDFTFDAEADIVVAQPKWRITTAEECELWFRQWTEYLAPFGRKVDCIIVLDDFYVDPPVAALWGEYRARLTHEYHRFSCRVRSNWNVRTYVLASGARFGAAVGEAESVDAARESITRARHQAGLPEGRSSRRSV